MSLDSRRYGLAIHTSSPELGLAKSNFTGDEASSTWELGRDLSLYLHNCLGEFLAPQTWQDLAFLAVAKGPGSFTGTRIGIVTAKTLGQQLEIPVFAISSLAAIAWQKGKGQEKAIALQMPAQRGQVFTAIYQVSPQGVTAHLDDSVMIPEQWQQTLNTVSIPYQLVEIPAGVGLGHSILPLLELAYLEWQQGKRPNWLEALPYYGQHPVDQG